MPDIVFLDNRLARVAGGGEQASMLNIATCVRAGWNVRIITQAGTTTALWREFVAQHPEMEVQAVTPGNTGDLAGLQDPDLSAVDLGTLLRDDDLAHDAARFNLRADEILKTGDPFDLLVVSCLPDILGIQPRAPTCLHVMGVPPSSAIAQLERPLLRRITESIFVSAFIRTEWFNLFDLAQNDPIIVRPGIHPMFTANQLVRTAKQYDFCFAGRMTERKGVRWLIDSLIAARRSKPDISCAFLGTGALAGIVNDLCADHPDSFVAPGALSRAELIQWLDACRVFVYPVLLPEAFGLAPLEAMARGLPSVSSARGGLAEYMQHEVNCLLVNPDKPETLSEQLLRSISNDVLLESLSTEARRTSASYPESETAHSTLEIYQRIIAAS